ASPSPSSPTSPSKPPPPRLPRPSPPSKRHPLGVRRSAALSRARQRQAAPATSCAPASLFSDASAPSLRPFRAGELIVPSRSLHTFPPHSRRHRPASHIHTLMQYRNILLLPLALCVIALSGCAPKATSKSLVGHWSLDAKTIETMVTDSDA